MATTQPPLTPDEFVLRRVPRAHLASSAPIEIAFGAFSPRPANKMDAGDVTGISVYRDLFITPQEIVDAIPVARRSGTLIVRLAVADLAALGLSVLPEDSNLLGHAVIPELSRSAYECDKDRVKVLLAELAKLAARDVVYHAP